MKQPIFFVGNAQRSDKFRVSTIAVKDDNGLVFRKLAETPSAREHIATIVKNFSEIKACMNKSDVSIVEPEMIDLERGSVDFAFVKGESLEARLFNALDNERNDEVSALLTHYVGFLKHFESESVPGSQTVFGDSSDQADSDSTSSRAMLDAIFSNILVSDNDEWSLIDYEWYFHFTVPSSFLLARAFTLFCLSYNESLRYSQDRIPQKELGAFVVPTAFLEFCTMDDIRIACEMEVEFQAYVLGTKQPAMQLERDESEPRPIRGAFTDFENRISDLESQVSDLTIELQSRTDQHDHALSRIDEIENSRTWLIGLKIGSFMKKLKPSRRND